MPPPLVPAAPPARPRHRPALAIATLATLLGVASLTLVIVALTRPNYSAAQRTAAKAALCDRFKPAMSAIHIETNGPDASLGRIALLNCALTLEGSTANSALDSKHRDAAQAAILAYQDLVVVSSSGKAGDPQFDSVVDVANTKERALKELCGD